MQHKQIADNIITQATAARLRQVSRQRISQLVKDERLSVARLPSGEVIEGAVYQTEVLNLQEGQRGRPRLTAEQIAARATHNVKEGDEVIWEHIPRDGYGFSILIPATVKKIGSKRVCLEFVHPASDNAPDARGARHGITVLDQAWVKPEVCLYDLKQLQLSEPIEPIGDTRTGENGKHAAEAK